MSLVRLILALVLATAAVTAAAQTFDTSFANFGAGNDAPIAIEADELEVKDRENRAVFSGNVTVTQGDSSLRASRLTVVYAGSAAEAATAPSTPQDQRISRLEASGTVLVAAGNQAASGDEGTVDFDARTLSLTGDVTLSQDENVITGDALTVDLATGIARVTSTGRVRVLLSPGGD